jgi:hypothetical protein
MLVDSRLISFVNGFTGIIVIASLTYNYFSKFCFLKVIYTIMTQDKVVNMPQNILGQMSVSLNNG